MTYVKKHNSFTFVQQLNFRIRKICDMYFRSLIFFSIFFILSSCAKKSKDLKGNDLEQWNLKGNIKSVSEINYSETGKYDTNILFNNDGFVTKQTSYNPDGSLIRKWVYKYDGQNRKLTRDCYVQKDSLSYTMHYYYNESGKIAGTKTVKSNGILGSQYDCQYDKNQNVIKETTIGENATFENLVMQKYNDKNNVISETYIDSVLHREWKQTYQYNSSGLKEEISYWSMQGKLIKKTIYTYTEDKKLEKVCQFDAEIKLVSTTSYKYDNQGNLIENLALFPDNKTPQKQTFQYKYDQQGNWTFVSESTNDKLGNIMTRKLVYF